MHHFGSRDYSQASSSRYFLIWYDNLKWKLFWPYTFLLTRTVIWMWSYQMWHIPLLSSQRNIPLSLFISIALFPLSAASFFFLHYAQRHSWQWMKQVALLKAGTTTCNPRIKCRHGVSFVFASKALNFVVQLLELVVPVPNIFK